VCVHVYVFVILGGLFVCTASCVCMQLLFFTQLPHCCHCVPCACDLRPLKNKILSVFFFCGSCVRCGGGGEGENV
jgi:hypothetical protein